MTESSPWVETLFTGLLPVDVIETARTDYEGIASTPLRLLGMDSLALAEVIGRLEKFTASEIDIEEFDIAVLVTLESLDRYIQKTSITSKPGS